MPGDKMKFFNQVSIANSIMNIYMEIETQFAYN